MNEHDDELLERLAVALRSIDPVPPDLVAAAKAARIARNLDAELAELIFDSAVDAAPLAVRGTALRSLSFRMDDYVLEVELDVDRGVLRGLLSPAADAQVHVRPDDRDPESVEADDEGRFRFEGELSETTSIELKLVVDSRTMVCRFDL